MLAEVAIAIAVSAATMLIATPLVMRLAVATNFLDHPVGYKGHGESTPYLGGLALVVAVLVATFVADLLIVMDLPTLLLLLICFAWAIGTVDDRVNLGPWLRVVLISSLGLVMGVAGFGWHVFGVESLDVALTVLWMLAVVNAFNLMDNMDGASASVGAVSAAGVGVLSALWDRAAFAVVSFALAAACLAFLRFNLTRPRARVFLGDGGSMVIGFTVAAMVMAGSSSANAEGFAYLVAAIPLVGLAALDTTLVMVSRRRRGVALWSGGRDHLTHRIREKLESHPRRVATVLMAGQALLTALGLMLASATPTVSAVAGAGLVLIGIGLVILLDSPAWRTEWCRSTEPEPRLPQQRKSEARPAHARA